MSAALSDVTLNLMGVGHVFQIPVCHVSGDSRSLVVNAQKLHIQTINKLILARIPLFGTDSSTSICLGRTLYVKV